MRRKTAFEFFCVVSAAFCLTACSSGTEAPAAAEKTETEKPETEKAEPEVTEPEQTEAQQTEPADGTAETQTQDDGVALADPTLLYMGHASLRIVTGEGKVIYVDPFSGSDYDMTADLILQTHDHFDHNVLSKITSRADDCELITQKEALAGGEYQNFDLGYVQVEAVEAYNANHYKLTSVGYILRFPNDVSVYISGDTSTTDQMATLAEEKLDYAFYCCDGVYNMDPAEAAACAELVGAKVNIPYHTGDASKTDFDADNAALFAPAGAKILKPGEELLLSKP